MVRSHVSCIHPYVVRLFTSIVSRLSRATPPTKPFNTQEMHFDIRVALSHRRWQYFNAFFHLRKCHNFSDKMPKYKTEKHIARDTQERERTVLNLIQPQWKIQNCLFQIQGSIPRVRTMATNPLGKKGNFCGKMTRSARKAGVCSIPRAENHL